MPGSWHYFEARKQQVQHRCEERCTEEVNHYVPDCDCPVEIHNAAPRGDKYNDWKHDVEAWPRPDEPRSDQGRQRDRENACIVGRSTLIRACSIRRAPNRTHLTDGKSCGQ